MVLELRPHHGQALHANPMHGRLALAHPLGYVTIRQPLGNGRLDHDTLNRSQRRERGLDDLRDVCPPILIGLARQKGLSPATVTRSMTRFAGKKSFDAMCCVARLSQNATEPGCQRNRHWTSTIDAWR
jgi:hypothetical protein